MTGSSTAPRPDGSLAARNGSRPLGRRLSLSRPSLPGVVLLGALWNCGGGERAVTEPGGGPDDGPTFATLTVRVLLDEANADTAGLGWETGVSGAEVHLLRNGTVEWETATADADGQVVFDRRLPGVYRLYAERRLSTDEAQSLGQPVRAFADGGTFTVPRAASTVTLHLLENRADGLVISEINGVLPPPWESASHNDGLYLEVYNASGDVRFLDGTLLASAYHLGFKDYDHRPCSASQAVRADPSGLHATQILEFPGAGSDYPIFPGEVKLVAQGAIDHRPVHPWLFDLRGADFEILGHGGADNPAVPNLREVGQTPFILSGTTSPLLAGLRVLFLAEPTDVGSLPISFRDHTGRGYVKIPAERIVEAVAFQSLWPDNDRESPPCEPMTAPNFDRYEFARLEIGLGVDIVNLAYQRVSLQPAFVMQNTNTSAADFVLAPHTPGSVP